MMSQDKEAQILDYLKSKEKQVPIDYQHDVKTGTHQYQFSMPRNNVTLKLSDEFVKDHPYEEIIRVIERSSIFKMIYEAAGLLKILITNQGTTKE